MNKLLETGLFGQGLLTLSLPGLVERYNACLRDMGLAPTGLSSFRVDGWGWSPEIAEERGDPNYLAHSKTAPPCAILLSPRQSGLPVYLPFHSFDPYLLRMVFQAAEPAIADLTAATAIWMDVDRELAAFREPADLLMVDAISLHFHDPAGLMKAAASQRELVHRFHNERMAWADRKLLQNLVQSVRDHGDLRYRSLTIPDLPYTHTRMFYTRAFGGLYVFRDLPGGLPLLVRAEAEPSLFGGRATQGHLEYAAQDPALLPLLYQERLVDLQWTLYRDQPAVLKRLQECLFMRALADSDPQLDLILLSEGERRVRLQELTRKDQLPELYHELDRLLRILQRQETPQLSHASPELTRALTHPHRSLHESAWNTVRHLLAALAPDDITRLYEYDKPGFFARYPGWPPNFQAWAAEFLRRQVLHRNG
jgi:hypothetical protein